MIYAPVANDIFAFLKPFSAGVWLAMFASSAFVATVATFMEVPMRRILRSPQGASHKLANLQWASAAMLLQVRGHASGGAPVALCGDARPAHLLPPRWPASAQLGARDSVCGGRRTDPEMDPLTALRSGVPALLPSRCLPPQAMQQFNARTTAARFAILGWAFVILILINT